jgi:thiol:disulfide interchange protein DsbC
MMRLHASPLLRGFNEEVIPCIINGRQILCKLQNIFFFRKSMLYFLMRKFILFPLMLMGVIILATVHTSFSADKCDHNCLQCHKISNEEAVNLLKENIPDVKVLEIRPAQVKGLWEFTIETNGHKGIAYIDFSKKYIISGSVFDIKDKTNLTQERFAEINKVEFSQIPLDDALVMGDKDAKYRVIVFDDPA